MVSRLEDVKGAERKGDSGDEARRLAPRELADEAMREQRAQQKAEKTALL